MSVPRVLLIGYYGQGNFGDDVLMQVTYRLLKQAKPSATISVIVNGTNHAYVQKLLPDAQILEPGRHGHVDLIVHGGGGVFFDFAQYGFARQILERILQTIGWRHYLAGEKMLRKLLGKPRTSSTHRLGMGIGVGSISPGSPRLYDKLPILASFDGLWVRDAQSCEQLKRFDSILNAEIIEGSDLAFLTQHWLPAQTPKIPSARPRLGIILRDWAENLGGIAPQKLSETLAELAKDYDITGFIFDAHADPELQRVLAPYTTHSWQPETMMVAEFAAKLAVQDVLLSSRAHGAICGACLGVPSVIVNIEPKLAQVHAMLPNASRLVPAQDTSAWIKAVAELHTLDAAIIKTDVEKNRIASEAALQAMQRWLA